MSRRYDKEGSKRRILSVCVKLFIEKGFKKTTNAEFLSLPTLQAAHSIIYSKQRTVYSLS